MNIIRNRAINWDKWNRKHDVMLWEAVALSIAIEPTILPVRNVFSDYSLAKCPEKFRDRFEVAASHSKAGRFGKIGPARKNQYSVNVSLGDFRSFAEDMGWDLPDEFPDAGPLSVQNLVPEYCPPYLKFMLEAVRALNLSPDDKSSKKIIEHWLIQHWPAEFGKATTANGMPAYKVRTMATFLRRPEQEAGGQSKAKKKASTL